MHAVHLNARTAPAVRADIARTRESSGVLTRGYDVSTETIRQWCKHGPEDYQNRSGRPHTLPWRAARRRAPSSASSSLHRLFPPTTSPSWSPSSCPTAIATPSTASSRSRASTASRPHTSPVNHTAQLRSTSAPPTSRSQRR